MTNTCCLFFQSVLSRQSSTSSSAPVTPSSISANALPFYPAADTVESVVESALDDMTVDDFDVSELEKELNNASHSPSSTLGDSFSALSVVPMVSPPVSIPGSVAACSPQSFGTPQSPSSHFSSSYGSTQMSQKVNVRETICLF